MDGSTKLDWDDLFKGMSSSNKDPYLYVPENVDANTPVIFFAPGMPGNSPGYGGYRNASSTGEIVNYINEHPDCIVILGTHCEKWKDQIGPSLSYIEDQYLNGNSFNNIMIDSFSYGSNCAVSTGIKLANELDENGNHKYNNLTISVGGTGSFIEKNLTQADCKALADTNSKVIFFCQEGGTNGSTEYQAQTLVANEPIVGALTDANVNTYVVSVNWKEAKNNGVGVGFGQHPATNCAIQKYWLPIQCGNEDAIDITNNSIFTVYVPKKDANGNINLVPATAEEYVALMPDMMGNYIDNLTKSIGVVEIVDINASPFYKDIVDRAVVTSKYEGQATGADHQYTYSSMKNIKSNISATASANANAKLLSGRLGSGVLANICACVNSFYSAYGNLLSSLSKECDSIMSLADAFEDMDRDLANKGDSLSSTGNCIVEGSDTTYPKSTDDKYQVTETANDKESSKKGGGYGGSKTPAIDEPEYLSMKKKMEDGSEVTITYKGNDIISVEQTYECNSNEEAILKATNLKIKYGEENIETMKINNNKIRIVFSTDFIANNY